jgi:hypothetical protein
MSDNVKLLRNIFGSMEKAIFLGDPLQEGRFACFMQPGELISTDTKENDSSKDMFLQASFCNKVIDTSIVNRFDTIGFGGNKELLGSIEEIYSKILTRNSLPSKELTTDQAAKAELWRAQMRKLKPKYEFYKGKVDTLQYTLSTERQQQNPNPALVADLRQKLQKAEQDWVAYGYKVEYKNAYAQFMNIMRINPQMYMQELRDHFDSHKRQDLDGNDYYQTFLSVPVSSWGSIRWNSFETTVAEKDDYHYSKSTSWSGGASGRWGLWSAGGGASGNKTYVHDKTSASTIQIKFEYITVRILRDWLNESLLQERFWTWNKQFGGSLLSDGGNINADPPVRPIGTMPVLVNQLVIARNVEISGDFAESELDYYREEIRTNASVGWGPFSISGSYTSITEEKHEVGSVGSNIIKMNHPQIIAKMGILLPQCPNPDPKLSFDKDDAWFPSDGLNEESSDIVEKALLKDLMTQAQDSATLEARIEAQNNYESELNRITSEVQNLLKTS